MSRLPTLSTPGRYTPSPSGGTGLPTPTAIRRPRSSLGPGRSSLAAPSAGGVDDEMDAALQEVLRTRPPSSLRVQASSGQGIADDDPDTPTQPNSTGLLKPRTPGLRPRTPSGIGHGAAPVTPGARPASRASVAGRASMSGSTTGGVFTPRRPSMASSTASASARRPESRASNAHGSVNGNQWEPVVGERVRMNSMGMEGTLRYVGEIQGKGGVFAGVELEGGFAGKGKNDGSVDGVQYFTCPPLCGVFTLLSKLSPPTSGPSSSRPSSQASHRSLASSSASFQISGSGRQTPSFPSTTPGRTSTVTPRRTSRAVSTSFAKSRMGLDESPPRKTLLGTSTSSNAVAMDGKFTAGSRASKYAGMTAKQLNDARATGLNASVRGLAGSTTTPKASRISMGGPGVTPSARPRQSFGGSLVTPRAAKGPRASAANALEMMPPPPSPGKIERGLAAHQARVEEEIRDLRRRNADLEEELRHKAASAPDATEESQREAVEEAMRVEALKAEVDRLTEEADSLRQQLSSSQADAADASRLAEELQGISQEDRQRQEELEKQINELRKEMRTAAERAAGELEAGMDEVRRMRERAEVAESEGGEMKALVEELTQAGQMTIELYETKQYDFEDKIRALEDKLRSTEEKLAKAREDLAKPPSPTQNQAATAAEIDNETLKSQVKHLQSKVSHLEEELEDMRAQAEKDEETWRGKVDRAKEKEREAVEVVKQLRGEVKGFKEGEQRAKSRLAELEGALKESQQVAEGVRGEVEGLRSEASEAASLRTALQSAEAERKAREKVLGEKSDELASLQERLDHATEVEAQARDLEAKVASLEAEITSLKEKAQSHLENGLPRPSTPMSRDSLDTPGERRSRLSTGSSVDDDKKLRGFQHIIQELSAENAELKDKYEAVVEEVALLKEEVKLLEETNALGDSAGAGNAEQSKELVEAKAKAQQQARMIEELHREVAELESLIESKIYREDELETRLQELERDLKAVHAKTAGSTHSRTNSTVSAASAHTANDGGEERCELCEGPHNLDACPVFAGTTLEAGGAPLGGGGKEGGKWCEDCESSEHVTSECPLAEDVF